jgi:hypothetical protein
MNTEDTRSIENITHGIAAIRINAENDRVDVLHFCGYFEEPSVMDYEELKRELEEDPEFGLVGEEYELIPAPQDLIEIMKNQINVQ